MMTDLKPLEDFFNSVTEHIKISRRIEKHLIEAAKVFADKIDALEKRLDERGR